ncbi:MAG: hypothetical protein HY889_07075 [Deltaproteobacteria bacterium]|nr:hypothetical protein [Deltaproteobacteria bacterium]
MSFRVAKRLLLVILTIMGIILSQKYSYPADSKTPGHVKTVKTDQVCMVNDTVMGKPQIPVPVDGKTYYGCCAGCVERIKGDRSVRFSKDPATGREVDKAKAFITAEPNGSALYFESRETAEKYYGQ